MTRKLFKICCQKIVWQGLAASVLLCWITWTYQRPIIHALKFIFISSYKECAYRRRAYELEEQSSHQYVTVTFHGRLGNWMFSYASLLGIARGNGYIPYFKSSHPLNSYFSLSKVQDKKAECLLTLYDDFPCSYNPQFMSLPVGNITLDSYLQSWKYFRFMEKEIRKEFRIHDHLFQRAQADFIKYVGHYLHKGHTVISIHVRRGDVLKPEARKLGFCHAPKAYFQNAMKYMLRRYPHAVFFVASDDIVWCQENISPLQLRDVFESQESFQQAKSSLKVELKLSDRVPIVFSTNSLAWDDFAMLTFCNHSIVSVGTFGWWSAWLANGEVVYYDSFPLPGTKLDYEMKKKDFFPQHWVALSGSVTTYLNCILYMLLLVVGFHIAHFKFSC